MSNSDDPRHDSAGEVTESAPAPAGATDADAGGGQAEFEKQRDEARANHDLYLRARADLENFRRRSQREHAEAMRFACEPLIRELLPVVDNLERALEHAGAEPQAVVEGVRMVLKSLLDVLEKHGVKRIDATGQPFDPTHHHAVGHVESAEHEPNHVIEQHHTGYTLHDRLLRPALVTVSKRKPDDSLATEQNSG